MRSALPRLSPLRVIVPICLTLLVAACDSPEERAEEHYQEGIALLEAGDPDRALVEFRNVFKLNGDHREARAAYARTVLDMGRSGEAYSQYLRLVEQYPQDLEARTALSEMSFMNGNWPEFERHSAVAIEIDQEDPQVKVISVARDLRQAVLDEDRTAQEGATLRAAELAETQADNALLVRVLLAGYLEEGKYAQALEQLDLAIEREPENRTLYAQKLSVLSRLGDTDAIEGVLKGMIERFESDTEIKAQLLRYYMTLGRVDDAETFLRDIADPSAEEPALFLSLVTFLLQQKGPEAALQELETAIADNPDKLILVTVRAGLEFEQGEQDKAIADMERTLASIDAEDPQGSLIRVTLAKMLEATGNDVGARRLVEEVLSTDASDVAALKMQAGWQIRSDDADEAIFSLRQALDQAPDDVEALSLMAEAHNRAGNKDLVRDFLSLAVEASENAVQPSLRFAQLLVGEERYRAAEDTLVTALRRTPGNVPILAALGNIYLLMEDTSRADQVLATLKRDETVQAQDEAKELELRILSSRDGTDEAIAFLTRLAKEDDSLAAKVGIVRARLADGQVQESLDYAEELLAEDPDNANLKYLLSVVQAAAGDLDQAQAGFRELVSAFPTRDLAWMQLFQVLRAQGEAEQARAVLDEAVAANPASANLLWAKASLLEREGDVQGAISIYDDLYERAPGSIVVANNLASLITAYSDDPGDVERAHRIARRLRDTTVPAFQDTYGWIAYRRGEYEEALQYLEPAAAGLPQDALVAYHWAMALLALDRPEEALAAFQESVNRAGDIDSRPQIEEARTKIRELQNVTSDQ